jgi:hypothetical protein
VGCADTPNAATKEEFTASSSMGEMRIAGAEDETCGFSTLVPSACCFFAMPSGVIDTPPLVGPMLGKTLSCPRWAAVGHPSLHWEFNPVLINVLVISESSIGHENACSGQGVRQSARSWWDMA